MEDLKNIESHCKGECRCNCKAKMDSCNNGHGSMCNGVFAPVCEPEVCDIPRFPHSQDLVVGNGTIDEAKCSNDKESCLKGMRFTIHIYREFTENFGEFALFDCYGALIFKSKKLECYHSPNEDSMVAIFHVAFDDDTSREITVFGKKETCESPAALYVYSAPLYHEEIRLGSELLQGKLNIYKDSMQHEH